MDTLTSVVEPLVQFLRTHAPEIYQKSDEDLREELSWYAAHNRILVLRDVNKDIAGVFTGYPIKSLQDIALGVWPVEDPDGKYFYGTLGALRPDYAARGLRIMLWVLQYIHKEFPKAEYLYCERYPTNESQLIPIRRAR